ncbi:MAG: hypothetical protein NUV67_06290 [archaeon]|nr:hypothetical protein [archaeon]
MFEVPEDQGLRRFSSEKFLLRNINALERSLLDENDVEKKQDIVVQLEALKHELSRLSGPGSSESSGEKLGEDGKIAGSREKLFRLLLERHARLIGDEETRTVGEIKAMVTKDDLTVQALAGSFMAENYVFEKDYLHAAQKAFDYVKNEIGFVDANLNISFWLTAKEIVANKLGDDEDQAVLLCSLLYALGDENAEVVVAELEDASAHAFVLTNFGGKTIILDPIQNIDFRRYFGEKSAVLSKYSYRGSKIRRFIFRFNNSNYEQFENSEF